MAAIPSLRAPRGPRLPATETHVAAQTRRLVALADRAELEAARLKGSLIDKEMACKLVQELAQGERDAILAWPIRAAPILAAELGVDPHALYEALSSSLRAHLTEKSEVRLNV